MPITHADLMLLDSAPEPFTKPGWIYELKHDGFRVLAVKQGSTVRLFSRNGRDMAGAFPELVEQMLTLPNVVLDGELVMLDQEGRPQFDRLFSRAFRTRHAADAAREDPACIFAFDLLALRGRDQRAKPLVSRKQALRRVLADTVRVRYAEHLDCGISLFQFAERMELEGIVAKRSGTPYCAGRSAHWVKIKTVVGRARELARMESRRR